MEAKPDSAVAGPLTERGVIKSDQDKVLIRLGNMYAPDVGLPKIADVTEFNYCSSCGTCEAICPVNAPVVRRGPVDISKEKNNYNKMELKTEVLFKDVDPTKQEINPCVNCYACERVCPILDGFPVDEFNNIRVMKAGKSKTLHGQDGAIVSQILKSLLEQGEIDCAVGVVRNEKWETKIVVFTKPEDVTAASGTKYTYQPAVSTMRDIHRAYVDSAESPLIAPDGTMQEKPRTYVEIKKILEKHKKVAFVGVPCQIHGAKLFRENYDRINLIIGLICMESFSEEIMLEEMVPKIMGVDIRDVRKMNFHKGNFIVETNKEVKEVPIKVVAPLARKGCHFCQDYTSYYADISVGSVGSDEGWSTVFVRTEIGEKYLDKVNDIEWTDKPINKEMVKKLADMKHKHNSWDWRTFMKEIWNRDTPVRPWGTERLANIPPPPPPPPPSAEKPPGAAKPPATKPPAAQPT
ncbi:MAG: F420H2 dehydrogenase-like protein [Candidatus Methanoperedens nitroreducens]|uniref:formate dehydrogenase (coenzyme F420) n=1 Tax=Candidatus Methanoperedens nitratireducens TaxID=1392998 RepID=A0A0P7ZEA4_9EURY|nr:Coenzyme F420 hydrogenase/dehydrogenase, beta subunit C-terminal domain [Candidatus Methanoperedens sp. BLZ2]KAB2945347.1 MAG: F420H2 dehydrogenase [Candidatus Methanoperedens sp.]KPQ43038.1 MAG: F420H2 dehydrogenase-like protein [Candidatus Methanoperedens sp. BLZ1]MBZ0176543.1 Coenzyme F420 hydrogenase/dehydrogenase, beta subunit C-terminal domain [Candidatus Methanoperedens nitroreducens]MCX9077861.1 Coenzyme F420 hydrogenase/dehydrogenase, beta subunit C-terminal domain [Candidatus Metha